MTTFYFVRHGQADLALAGSTIYNGQGYNMVTLSEVGIRQIEETAKRPELKEAQLIVSSPFGRALHTAAILSKALQLDIRVETKLHEWQPDVKGYTFLSDEEAKRRYDELTRCHGEPPEGTDCDWETATQMKRRTAEALEKYKQYDCVIVVCHGTLMQYVLGVPHPKNGEIAIFNS